MKRCRFKFVREEFGVTSVEYAVIAGTMVLAIVSVLPDIGLKVSNFFRAVMAVFW